MAAWPTPSNVKHLCGFLGLTGYYRRFITNYAVIAAPLTDLLKNDVFRWGQAADKSFEALKSPMTSAPVLRLPDFARTFYIETDAFDFGIGDILLQKNHPLAFFSKKLGVRRRSASTFHKELYAIVEAVQKWRQYLLGREFVIRSDQKSLKELLQQIIQTPDQQFYVRKLMGYKFRIEYKTGASNKVADALSRRDPDETADGSLLVTCAHPMPMILDDIRRETEERTDMVELRVRIDAGTTPSHLSYCDDLVHFKRHIYISPHSPSKDLIMHEHHSTHLAGHLGHDRTFRRIATSFYWPRMRSDIDISSLLASIARRLKV